MRLERRASSSRRTRAGACTGWKSDGERSTAVETREGFVPLEYTCTFADGTIEHRVMAANVVVAGALTGAAACAVTVRLGRATAAVSSAPA